MSKQDTHELVEFARNDLGMVIKGVMYQGKPMFDALSVAKALEYANPNAALQSLKERFDEVLEDMGIQDDGKNFATIKIPGSRSDRTKNLKICSEAALYELILGSRIASARKFRYWVVNDVLPQIRENGGYIDARSDKQQLIKLQDTVQRLWSRSMKNLEAKEVWKNRALSTKGSLDKTNFHALMHLEYMVDLLEQVDTPLARQKSAQLREFLTGGIENKVDQLENKTVEAITYMSEVANNLFNTEKNDQIKIQELADKYEMVLAQLESANTVNRDMREMYNEVKERYYNAVERGKKYQARVKELEGK